MLLLAEGDKLSGSVSQPSVFGHIMHITVPVPEFVAASRNGKKHHKVRMLSKAHSKGTEIISISQTSSLSLGWTSPLPENAKLRGSISQPSVFGHIMHIRALRSVARGDYLPERVARKLRVISTSPPPGNGCRFPSFKWRGLRP